MIGCIVMDNMLAQYPEMAISYSRGSQGWTNFKEEWTKLTEEGIFLGPPHRIMATKAFPKLLKSAIIWCSFWIYCALIFQRGSNSQKRDRNI